MATYAAAFQCRLGSDDHINNRWVGLCIIFYRFADRYTFLGSPTNQGILNDNGLFLLYFKPSIVAWNLNRDLTSYSLFSLVLGERLSYAIIVLLRFMLFPILLPITLAVVVPIAFIAILLQYVFNPDYVRPRPDYRSLAKSYFFPQPMINADGQLRQTALDDGIIVSPGLRLNPFYYTGIKARVQHRYFVVIFFVNLILGATGVIWLGTHVFAHMGHWTHREEFEGVLKTGFEPHVSESAS